MKKYIVVHPDNLKRIKEKVPSQSMDSHFQGLWSLNGVPIRMSPNCPKYKKKYIIPKTRFIEYEVSDMDWVNYFGFGPIKEVETDEPAVFILNEPEYAFEATSSTQMTNDSNVVFKPNIYMERDFLWQRMALFFH